MTPQETELLLKLAEAVEDLLRRAAEGGDLDPTMTAKQRADEISRLAFAVNYSN